MKKNSLNINEIDLLNIFKIILREKLKIILITIISILIGFGYSSQIPNKYLLSLHVKQNSNSEFNEIFFISDLFGENNQVDKMFFDRFNDELQDKKEFLINIKNTKKFRENILKESLKDPDEELQKYSNLFEIKKINKKKGVYLNLEWENIEEAKNILQNTINLTITNLEKSVHHELYRNLEIEKKVKLSQDIKRIDYLSEQSSIAKELNILDNQADKSMNLNQQSMLSEILSSFSNLSFHTNTGFAYYLRGYRVIDKEIELIKNRKYQKFKFIEDEIRSLQNDNIDWILYNINQINIKSLKNNRLIIITSTLLGLMAGLFFVFILNMSQLQTSSKKK